MTIEVEAKFPVHRLAQLQLDAEKLGFRFPDDAALEQDDYFNHPSRDFRQTDEALRIRRCGSELVLTWKGPRLDNLSKTRHELEVPFPVAADQIADKLQSLTAILLALGFTHSGCVRKLRRSASLVFEGRTFHCSLDDVSGLPLHAELETLCEDCEKQDALQSLLRLAASLNLQQQERRSYLELVLTSNRDDSAPPQPDARSQ
jgi:adenylate cyclase class 2